MRKVLYVVAWLALVWVICSPPGAIALPQNEIYRTYYQEPEFLTEVGEYDFACHGKLKPRWRRWLANKTMARLASMYCYLRNDSDCMVVTAER